MFSALKAKHLRHLDGTEARWDGQNVSERLWTVEAQSQPERGLAACFLTLPYQMCHLKALENKKEEWSLDVVWVFLPLAL